MARTNNSRGDCCRVAEKAFSGLVHPCAATGRGNRRRRHRRRRSRRSRWPRPNILVIFGDDIGTWNVGAYTHGMMGQTPNIDRIAREGMLFTDHYGQPSCTAGRAAFIMGQLPVRTGMTTVGIPGSTRGIQKEDPTLAEVLKPLGLRDRPVRQEPPRRPQRIPADRARLRRVVRQPLSPQRRRGARGARLPGQKNPRVQAEVRPARRAARLGDGGRRPDRQIRKFGRVGKQKIEDTGPLTRKRMETFDNEVTRRDAQVAGQGRQGRQAVLLLVQLDRDPHLVAPATEVRADGGG